jgi:hypothetical protein
MAMSEPSKYKTGPPPAATASPVKALGGILVFVGLFLLFMGGSQYFGGATTENMYSGTVLEHNADVNRITSNVKSEGATMVMFGLLALGVGGVMVAPKKQG